MQTVQSDPVARLRQWAQVIDDRTKNVQRVLAYASACRWLYYRKYPNCHAPLTARVPPSGLHAVCSTPGVPRANQAKRSSSLTAFLPTSARRTSVVDVSTAATGTSYRFGFDRTIRPTAGVCPSGLYAGSEVGPRDGFQEPGSGRRWLLLKTDTAPLPTVASCAGKGSRPPNGLLNPVGVVQHVDALPVSATETALRV
jgi:hypothetical protein